MPDPTPARPTDLPSERNLLRSTLIAAAVAVLLLVTVVLPAEYGVDPTRIGRVLGLTRMGEIKVALAKEAAAADSVDAAARAAQAASAGPAAAGPAAASAQTVVPTAASPGSAETRSDLPQRSDVTEIALRPNEGKEIKLVMQKDARVSYAWSTDRGVVNYDTHADAPGIRYHGYAKGKATPADSGILIAAFDGSHGWFWRNRGSAPVRVTLRTSGAYQDIKRVQ